MQLDAFKGLASIPQDIHLYPVIFSGDFLHTQFQDRTSRPFYPELGMSTQLTLEFKPQREWTAREDSRHSDVLGIFQHLKFPSRLFTLA